MADREKVIDILGACGTDDCDNCPLNGDERCSGFVDVPVKVLMDALALLKEQEERVLTWEEVDKSGNLYVWTEIHSFYSGRGCLIYCTVVRSEFFDELFRLREDSGLEWTRTEEDYNRNNYQGAHSGWRCWTARPTEEQRKAVAWDG